MPAEWLVCSAGLCTGAGATRSAGAHRRVLWASCVSRHPASAQLNYDINFIVHVYTSNLTLAKRQYHVISRVTGTCSPRRPTHATRVKLVECDARDARDAGRSRAVYLSYVLLYRTLSRSALKLMLIHWCTKLF